MLACTSFDLKTKCSGISSPILTKYFLDPSSTRKFLFVIPPLMEEIFILPFQKLIPEIICFQLSIPIVITESSSQSDSESESITLLENTEK